MSDTAHGGDGGGSNSAGTGNGGAGGSASSTAINNSLATPPGTGASAWGGAGGNGSNAGKGGNGGNAIATASSSSNGTALDDVTAHAFGGAAGNGMFGMSQGTVGTAQASATSNAGLGEARALAAALGSGGFANATAISHGASLIALSAHASAPVGSLAVAEGYSSVGHAWGDAPTTTNPQAYAYATGLPSAADLGRAIAGTTNVQSTLGHENALGLLSLGGTQSTSAGATHVLTSDVRIDINANDFAQTGEVSLGLFNPVATGNGFGALEFIVRNELTNAVIVDETFGSLTAAQSFFSDHVLSLGTLGSISGGGSAASLDISLLITATTRGSGFGAQMLVSAVPEPSALVLATIAGLSLLAAGLSRRKG